MDVLEAAVKVLDEQRKPLHWTVIQDIALQRGYLDPFTQKDIRRKLVAALSKAAKDPAGAIEKRSTGVYALRAQAHA
ncbi:MAG: HTH domain-containing protein [Actinomycetota bacterium]